MHALAPTCLQGSQSGLKFHTILEFVLQRATLPLSVLCTLHEACQNLWMEWTDVNGAEGYCLLRRQLQ